MLERRTLLLLAAGLVVLFFGAPFIPGATTWDGWPVISSLGTAAAGGALLLVAWQILLQQRGHSLEQVRFAMDLADRFHVHGRAYEEAWQTLRSYADVPNNMKGSTWNEVVNALAKVYEGVHFLRQIERLRNRNIVSTELLTLLYFDPVVGHVDGKIRYLTRWLGTGLDLAANYSAREVGMLLPEVESLVRAVSIEHERNGGPRYEHIFDAFASLNQEVAEARVAHDQLRSDHQITVDWNA